MNYHNFANRLSLRRLAPAANVKEPAKAATKKRQQPARRRLATATALAFLSLLALRMGADAQPADAHAQPPAWPRSNAPTLVVTLIGLGVVLLRIPALWRRDLDC